MESIKSFLENASRASLVVKLLDPELKSKVLLAIATKLRERMQNILEENKLDLDKIDDSDPKKDRLLLNSNRIEDLAKSVESISMLPDPSNKLLSERILDNGLLVQKITVPLGVVGVIYESRPNVTIDVATLCIQSGNACVLRGGSDAFYTNNYLVNLIQEVLSSFNLDLNIVQLLPVDRKFMPELLTASQYVDILIPRGSQQLIDYVRENATVPVIETGAGVCHTYVEASADLEMAANIIVNAKTSRPSVCNSLDTVIVEKKVLNPLMELIAPKLVAFDVEIFADLESYSVLKELNYPFLKEAKDADFGREYLDFKCSIKMVNSFEEAVKHIRKYSSKHSEAIISKNMEYCERFLNEVDAAAVFTNASTRFTDGGVFGLGAEIGISTQKLHARGPFALEKLITEKWIIRGQGHIR